MRVAMRVAYDGTNYCGWQIQPNGLTIEEVLNTTLSELLGETIVVSGASRTDTGVHSLGNIAVFDTNHRMPADKIAFALNQRLPDDIAIQESWEAPEGWHPRFVKSRKTYEYRILNCKMPLPTERLYTYHYHYPLDVEKMNTAIQDLIGEHDFTSFASVKSQVNSFVRTIYEASVVREGNIIKIRVTGNGFLYNMVRIIAGTLIEIGNERRPVSAIRDALDAKERSSAGPTAPAEGLTMISWTPEENLLTR
ncbi:MAG: tRNA pseudouridine(38-40) synthase TruA [Lachnospiraceae bacterium]|nr:tRNA pseudouridine(38-40) synthase TruA [Lachnospiraceae bacterium]